jgi:putative nucleotidyltransferase with HDIG domain
MEVQVRDPVHNFITLREKQVKLIGTRAVQRLRGIRQLALANLVYPGAVHTRFDHTLGVTHIAGLMAHALGLDADQVELVQHAALLHDIGHGPFSHVSEGALERYADRTKLPADQKKEKIHEIITAHMIRTDRSIVNIIGQEGCNQVAKLLSEGHGQPALKSIVSGPLDADKQDYLLRDSRFCGVQYGVFDIHQLHRSLVLVGRRDEEELMVKPDSIHAVEQFVLAKYYLTTNVYRHKVRLITDQMILRAIVLGIEHDGNEQLRQLYTFGEPEPFVNNYMRWDDARFLGAFGTEDDPSRCGQMLARLRERRLLKRVFWARIKDLPAEIRDLLTGISKREQDHLRGALERVIAEEVASRAGQQIDPDFVIVHPFDIKSVRETSRNEEEGILVDTSPEPKPFINESTLFASINEGYVDQFIEVYAPVSWDTPADKNRIRRECYEPIKSLIEKLCRETMKGAKKE